MNVNNPIKHPLRGSLIKDEWARDKSKDDSTVSVRYKFPINLSVSEALFCLCRGTNIITLLGCDRISGHVPQLFISLYLSFLSLWILILLVREKHRKTLYRFLLIKINLGR